MLWYVLKSWTALHLFAIQSPEVLRLLILKVLVVTSAKSKSLSATSLIESLTIIDTVFALSSSWLSMWHFHHHGRPRCLDACVCVVLCVCVCISMFPFGYHCTYSLLAFLAFLLQGDPPCAADCIGLSHPRVQQLPKAT